MTKTSNRHPSHEAFVIDESGKKPRWYKIGAMWPNAGGGYSLILKALPPEGRIALRVPKDESEEEGV